RVIWWLLSGPPVTAPPPATRLLHAGSSGTRHLRRTPRRPRTLRRPRTQHLRRAPRRRRTQRRTRRQHLRRTLRRRRARRRPRERAAPPVRPPVLPAAAAGPAPPAVSRSWTCPT